MQTRQNKNKEKESGLNGFEVLDMNKDNEDSINNIVDQKNYKDFKFTFSISNYNIAGLW